MAHSGQWRSLGNPYGGQVIKALPVNCLLSLGFYLDIILGRQFSYQNGYTRTDIYIYIYIYICSI